MHQDIEQLLFHYHADNKTYNIKQKGHARWLHTGGKEIQSSIDVREPQALMLSYQRPFTGIHAFLDHPPKRMLMLGMGAGSIGTYFQQRYPESELTIVDIEPMMFDMAEDYFFFKPNEHTHYIVSDAYEFLKEYENSFDLILCDIFGMKSMPEVMLSPTFYHALKLALTEQGRCVMNLICESQQQFMLFMSWIRHAFDCKTISHGIQNTRNVIAYAFRNKNWETRFNQLVRHKLLPQPLTSKIIGHYLESYPADFDEMFANHFER